MDGQNHIRGKVLREETLIKNLGNEKNHRMQKHPIAECSNLYKAIGEIRSHWEVAPYDEPIVQAMNKYFNETSSADIISLKSTNWIYKSFNIMKK